MTIQMPLPGEESTPTPEPRTLRQIAREIREDWSKVNYAAEPYLAAMSTLTTVRDNYFEDSGRSVVAYFLANASAWRGTKAREIKAELKALIK